MANFFANYPPRVCPFCLKQFTPEHGKQRYCSKLCENRYRDGRFHLRPPKEIVGKPLDEWVREASECGLDYGTYRQLRENGKSYDELKAAGYHSATHAKTYMRHR